MRNSAVHGLPLLLGALVASSGGCASGDEEVSNYCGCATSGHASASGGNASGGTSGRASGGAPVGGLSGAGGSGEDGDAGAAPG